MPRKDRLAHVRALLQLAHLRYFGFNFRPKMPERDLPMRCLVQEIGGAHLVGRFQQGSGELARRSLLRRHREGDFPVRKAEMAIS